MLHVLLHVGSDRYALPARQVISIHPWSPIQPAPADQPDWAGVRQDRGRPVPVLDLQQRLLGRPVKRRLGTRLVLAEVPDAACPGLVTSCLPVFLLAERVTETRWITAEQWVALSGVSAGEDETASAKVVCDAEGLIRPLPWAKLMAWARRASTGAAPAHGVPTQPVARPAA